MLGWYRARIGDGHGPELSQAMLRLGIVSLGLFYTAWVTAQRADTSIWLWAISVGSVAFSATLVGIILKQPDPSPARRVLGSLHDNVLVSLWLFEAGPTGTLFLFVYPFVTIGNGFRFGVPYLACSGALGALGIGSLVLFAPEWRPYGVIGAGVFLSHVFVTVYTGALLKRMHSMQQQLHTLAMYDGLTGLPNRRVFMDKLARVLARPRSGSVACLYFDLDGFKPINDRYGHELGDRLLKVVARQVSSNVRVWDTVARLGGDEFAVLLSDVFSPGAAEAAAARIIQTIEAITNVDGNEVQVSASVGIALVSCSPEQLPIPADTLLKSADEAMYAAKKQGKGLFTRIDLASPPASALSSSPTAAWPRHLEGALAFRDSPASGPAA